MLPRSYNVTDTMTLVTQLTAQLLGSRAVGPATAPRATYPTDQGINGTRSARRQALAGAQADLLDTGDAIGNLQDRDGWLLGQRRAARVDDQHPGCARDAGLVRRPAQQHVDPAAEDAS